MADLTAIQFLRTSTAGKIPSVNVLHEGALAINLTDRTIYTKNASGAIIDLGFGKGGAVKGNIDLTGNLTGTGVVSAPTGNFTTSNITTLNASNMTITGVAQAIRKFTVVESGNPAARIDLVTTPTQSQAIGMYSTESTDYTSFNSEIGGSKLLEIRKGKSGQKPQVISYGEFISNDIIAKNLRFSNDYGQYAIEALTAQAYSGSGDTNGINFVFRGRSNSSATIYHTIIDGRAGTNNQVAHYHGNTPQHKIWAYGSAGAGGWGNFVGSLSVGFDGLSGLNRGLAVGHELSGLVGSQNQLSLYAGNVETLRIAHDRTIALKAVNIYAGGLANNSALLMTDTSTDNNGIGDGRTHIGYLNSGKFHHYFRGTGEMNIATHLGVNISIGGLITNGEILSNTRVTAKGTTTSFNGLRSETSGNGWSYLALKSGSSEAHIAYNNTAAEGGIANSLHLRPNGTSTGSLILQPNSSMLHQTQYGTIKIGSLNASHAHFDTDRPSFYFYKPITSAGQYSVTANTLDNMLTAYAEMASKPAAYNIEGQYNVGTVTRFISFGKLAARHSGGYTTHLNFGLVKDANSWGDGVTGMYVALGGSDASPTQYFTLAYGGKIKHSNGIEFYSTAFKPSSADIGALPVGSDSVGVQIHDARNGPYNGSDVLPNQLSNQSLKTTFTMGGATPTGSWVSKLSVKGWNGDYAAWELGSGASTYADGKLWYRYGIGASWNAWDMVYTTRHKPSAQDVNALPISGGTLTGQLTVNVKMILRDNGSTASNGVLKHQVGSGGETWITAINDSDLNHSAIGVSQDFGPQCWINRTRYKLYHQGFKPTAAEIGSLPITGGTMTGNLHASTGGIYPAANNASQLGNSDWIWASAHIRDLTVTSSLNSTTIGVNNTNSSNGYGLSLYGGAVTGQPTYGLMFAGTATFGKLGSVTSDWATYFNMNADATRGWIFKAGVGSSGNVASISGNGNAYFVGNMEAQEVYARGWLRTTNSSGWYNETYAGGIHMSDSTWVRIYNKKQFFVDSTASDAIRTSGGVTATGNISASTFSGNGSALTGLTSAQVGLGNVPNAVHTTNPTANTVVVRDGSGWVNAAGFRGNGSQLTNLSWSNIVGRPTETNQWHTVHNSPAGSGTNRIALPSAAINHLVAGQMVKFRVWLNRSNAANSERFFREIIVDGSDGWSGTQSYAPNDVTWPGVSYCWIRNAHASNDVASRNTISSQYSNITRFEYQLL
ncbi:long tail fiber protein distal subunit [Pseudomonas phage PspYZU05]|uniref:Uncharacterized protein n=1 Tax=Pseudomonas phage PspYZU05 TaxID=1983556 RepID=A0A2U7NJL9_9CAUD|nr:long tail fiber protein distal subunit [Pseudomonas phage PspYZU05]ASD52134.1 hypothetical protein PspYZU05_182 [Pseudomonas phage PspYZU05]